jgi:hypothetical protein
MKATQTEPPVFEFYLPDVDTLLQVREADGEVVIRTTRNSLSARRKSAFVRALAAEGFISDSYRWFSAEQPPAPMAVRWLVDFSWVRLPEAALRQARRFMVRLLAGGFVLWAVLVCSLLHR